MPRDWEAVIRIDMEKRAEEIRTGRLPDDEYILTCPAPGGCGERERTFSDAYRDHWLSMHADHGGEVMIRHAPDGECEDLGAEIPEGWGYDSDSSADAPSRSDPPF